MQDLRLALASSYLARPVVVWHAAPRLGAGGRPIASRPPDMHARQHFAAEGGGTAQSTTVESLWAWWNALVGGLNRLVYQTGTTGLTGVDLPREVQSSTAARTYLADLVGDLAPFYGWPPAEVEQHQRAMRAVGNAGTVVTTIDRVVAIGLPENWPGRETWYSIADDMQRAAALTSLADQAEMLNKDLHSAAEVAQRGAAWVGDRADRVLDLSANLGHGTGTGLGFALGLGVLGVVAWFAAPGIVAAQAARR